MEITDKELCNEIKEYCKINGLKTHDFINRMLREAFTREKYGMAPPVFSKKSEKNSTFVATQPEPVKKVQVETIVVKNDTEVETPQQEEITENKPTIVDTKSKPKRRTLN